jgi:hypothetical protein
MCTADFRSRDDPRLGLGGAVVLGIVNTRWAISNFSGIAYGELAIFAQRAIGCGLPAFASSHLGAAIRRRLNSFVPAEPPKVPPRLTDAPVVSRKMADTSALDRLGAGMPFNEAMRSSL